MNLGQIESWQKLIVIVIDTASYRRDSMFEDSLFRAVALRGEREGPGRMPLSAGLPGGGQRVPTPIVASIQHHHPAGLSPRRPL